ncbi:hypothetical protein NMY22_g11987 [Coprinellus aureogranulatus]|nr:hypothetical protein NMY22_g11987 [Coprinellus aureogranulatus]
MHGSEDSSTSSAVAARLALLYHYTTTFDEEVSQIWSQSPRKLGKILFLATRYSTIVEIVSDFATDAASSQHAQLRKNQCTGMPSGTLRFKQYDDREPGIRNSANCSAYSVSYLHSVSNVRRGDPLVMLIRIAGRKREIPLSAHPHVFPVAPSLMDTLVGWPCNFGPVRHQNYYAGSAYLAFVRTLTALIGFVTITRRYRKQKPQSDQMLNFVVALTAIPGIPVRDKYQIVGPLRLLLINVFVERLLLRMKQIDDADTQAVISALVFDHDNRTPSDTEVTASEAVSDEVCTNTHSEKPGSNERSIA